jgi:hypothetical protein
VLKTYPNETEEWIPLIYFREQADNEYSFNYVIDQSWKIFATVLGSCMPSHENAIPHLTTRFFALYTEDFLWPVLSDW